MSTHGTTSARARTPLACHQVDGMSGGPCPTVEFLKLCLIDVTERVRWRKKCQTKGVSKQGGDLRRFKILGVFRWNIVTRERLALTPDSLLWDNLSNPASQSGYRCGDDHHTRVESMK